MAGTRYDVIVVGTRVAGAATAILLARRGLRVLAVDRARFPSDTLSTHQIQLPGVACLHHWGLLDRLIAAGAPEVGEVRFDVRGVLIDGSFPMYRGIAALHSPRRTVLDALLVQAAREAGAEVREGFRVDGLVWQDGRVAGIRGMSTVEHAALVIGADGKHSLVAGEVDARVRRYRPPSTLATYAYWEGVPLTRGELYHRSDRAVAAFPTNDGLTLVYVAAPLTAFDAWRTDVEAHYLATLDRCADLGHRVRAGRRAERFRTTIDLPNTIRRAHGPGWALVGDAGLVMDPISAQGISNAFVDAELLAGHLDDNLGNLAAYEATRDARHTAMFDFTVALAGFRPTGRVERLVLRAIARRPASSSQFLAAFAGATPLADFRSPRNALRLLTA